MSLQDVLYGVQIAAVIDGQYGDTGKGKFSDILASQWADITARGTGGGNAGHTVVVNGKRSVFHELPAGITQDGEGKKTILGNGMVINPDGLCKELDELDANGGTYNNLLISADAHVVMPYHIAFDKAKNQSQKNGGIGSTGKGIGPAYTDKTMRKGITMLDLLDRDLLVGKIKQAKERYPNQEINLDNILDQLRPCIERLEPFVCDTISYLHESIRAGKKINIEGAQGLFLSVEHGMHPYVTSSDPSLNGTATGVGISAKLIDLPITVLKFPFMTRVGGGPFTTELGGSVSEEYCAKERTKEKELQECRIPYERTAKGIRYDHQNPSIISMMNHVGDAFTQGEGIRLAADEYGATTGRPRRIGWTDAVLARHAAMVNGGVFALTKADCLAGINEFKVAYGYESAGKTQKTFTRNEQVLRSAIPKYRTYRGFDEISGVRTYDALPESLRMAITDLEKFSGIAVAAISIGADRDATIFR